MAIGSSVPEDEKEPKAVLAWRKKFQTRNAICGVRCEKHKGTVPGFCERSSGHVGMHSHELRPGMDGFDPKSPKGHSWDSSKLRNPRRRPKPPKTLGPF